MFIQRLLLSLTTASSSSSSSFFPSTSSFSFSSSCSAPRRRTQHRKTDTRQAEDTSGRGKVNREKFLARRVTVGLVACFFFFDPCHATLLSSRLPSRAEGIFRFIHRWTPDPANFSTASNRHRLLLILYAPFIPLNIIPRTSTCIPFQPRQKERRVRPTRRFERFFFCHVCLSPRPGQRSFFDSSVIERARPRDIDFFASYAFRTSPPGDDHPFQSFYSMEGFFVISRLLCIVRVLYIHTRARVLHVSFIQNSLSRMNFARFQREN